MEAVEQQADASDEVSDYENWENEYDKMYEDQVYERENRENSYDKMYD